MARLALGVAGAVVGGLVGGPVGASIGFSIGSTLGGLLFPPDQPPVARARVDDLRVQVSTYGAPIPLLYGLCRLPGNYIWAMDLVEREETEEVGGKGGGGQEVTTYTYWGNAAVAFCAGPAETYFKIWADGKLIANYGSGTEEKYPGKIRRYLGDEGQLPDPLLEADQGVGQVPAFRGLVYLVLEDFPLSDFGNRYPNITAEICAHPESA